MLKIKLIKTPPINPDRLQSNKAPIAPNHNPIQPNPAKKKLII